MPMIQVAGKVASSIATQTGKGIIKVWEKTDFRGQEKFVLWTCWFDMPQLHVGEHDEIMIDGRLSTKIGQYTAKTGEERTSVEHHINDATIKTHTPNEKPMTLTATPVRNLITEQQVFVDSNEVPF